MNEIEVKILDIDPKKVVAKLKSLKAKKIEQGILRSTLFDYPDGRLMKGLSFIRVREFTDRTELVLKLPTKKGRCKSMEEIEMTVGDYATAVRMFTAIGLEPFAEYEKYRATYKIGKIKFEFDKMPGVPWFMEVEAQSEKDVKKGVGLIGFSMGRTTNIDGGRVSKKYGVSTKFLTFGKMKESPNYAHLFR
jgi:predicted adenylyl cyclase CyaB